MPQDFTDSAGNGGAQSQPAANTSLQPGQQNSQNAEMPEWAKTLSKRLDGIERMAQGDKDRAVAKVSRELEGYKPVLQRLSGLLGMSDEQIKQAERELEYDALKAKVFGEQQGNPATGNRPEPQVDTVGEVAKELGLSLDDPEVVEITRQGDTMKAIKAFAALAVKRAQAPQPSAAINAAPTSGASTPAMSEAEYNARVSRLNQLYRSPTNNAAEIAKLEKELGW